MAEPNNKNKTKLLIAMLIAIIVLLFSGIVYQFVVIKNLESKLSFLPNAISYVIEKDTTLTLIIN